MTRFAFALALLVAVSGSTAGGQAPAAAAPATSAAPSTPTAPVTSTAPAVSEAPAASDRISGKVVDAKTGAPLARAMVTLTELHSQRAVATTYTTPDGQYHFEEAVPAGKYRLEGHATGHLNAAYLQHAQLSTAIVTGAGLPTSALVLSLIPAASIAGRVTDQNGDPVPHATVSLFRQSPENDSAKPRNYGMRSVDDNGFYDFDNVGPGRYFAVARGVPWYAVHAPVEPAGVTQLYQAAVDPALDVAYASVFFPAAQSADGASPIDISGGEQITADMQLVPVHAVSLVLRLQGTGPGRPMPQLTEDVFGTPEPVRTMSGMDEDSITMSGLAPGRYMLRQFTGNGNRMPVNMGTIDLSSGSAVRNLGAVPGQSTLTVRLIAADGQSLPSRAQVSLISKDAGFATSSSVNEAGEATFDSVSPGDYQLRVSGKGRQPSISSVTVSGHAAQGATLHVGEGSTAATVLLAGTPLRVEGFVRRGDKPAVACMVVLVPATASADTELFRRDQTDLDGSFTLPGVAPGRYLLIALEDAWKLPWTDLHALEPYLLRATPLIVTSSGSGEMHLAEPLAPVFLH